MAAPRVREGAYGAEGENGKSGSQPGGAPRGPRTPVRAGPAAVEPCDLSPLLPDHDDNLSDHLDQLCLDSSVRTTDGAESSEDV